MTKSSLSKARLFIINGLGLDDRFAKLAEGGTRAEHFAGRARRRRFLRTEEVAARRKRSARTRESRGEKSSHLAGPGYSDEGRRKNP